MLKAINGRLCMWHVKHKGSGYKVWTHKISDGKLKIERIQMVR